MRKTTETKTTRTARETYDERRSEIAALLDTLGQEVNMHTEYAEKEGLHWGHAGDLGHVKELLVQTLAFLAQRDEADIQDYLDDLKSTRS